MKIYKVSNDIDLSAFENAIEEWAKDKTPLTEEERAEEDRLDYEWDPDDAMLETPFDVGLMREWMLDNEYQVEDLIGSLRSHPELSFEQVLYSFYENIALTRDLFSIYRENYLKKHQL